MDHFSQGSVLIEKITAYVKPLAKKPNYLADLGEFEGFVDLYPCRSA